MTDVRLTATNPEDSSVVPVACNAKGELLLEEPTLASDGYVAKTGDNMTGDLTLGTDKITLGVDGSSEFTKSIYVNDSDGSGFINYSNASDNSYINLGPDVGTAGVVLGMKVDTTSSDPIFYTFNKNNTSAPPTVSIKANGSAEFAGTVSAANTTLTDKRSTQGPGWYSLYIQALSDPSNPNSALTPKATITNDGSATFAGDIEVGKYATNGTTISASGAVAVNRNKPDGTCFYALLNGAVNTLIKADGSAEFASSAGFGGQSLSAGMIDGGVRILDGYIQLRRDVEGAEIVSGFSGGNTGAFKTVSIRSDGTAEFASDVVVGSRNKKWMLVESNGLCHMVEQPTASTADLVAPAAAAEYPPLRDVFAELNAIEKALGEVMEKLRMTPPAGWEVWDGSDENS